MSTSKRPKIVALTGSGISAESGIPTFRDENGLWEGHDVMEVATPEGFEKNPELVLNFYNQRRRKLNEVKPNNGHLKLAELEEWFDVTVITQNVDDLHERAGSSNIIHLHGEITKARSTTDPHLIYNIGYRDINLGDKCDNGGQLRPHIVWFGEMVPMMEPAMNETMDADIVLVVGTSLLVYPAAGLVQYAKDDAEMYVVDPKLPDMPKRTNIHAKEKSAGEGMKEVVEELKEKFHVA